jgi:hypothetical protein
MSSTSCLATIRGVEGSPSILEVNVRSGPGTNQALVFKSPVGTTHLRVLEVAPDIQGLNKDGKVYQWFRLEFGGGTTGWVRDDLIEIEGDCARYGYDAAKRTRAFSLKRETIPAAAKPTAQPAPQPAASLSAPSATGNVPFDMERVKRAAFAITAAFEGTGYAAYNNYDAGIVSYGLIQFTLAAGSLKAVVDRYLAKSNSATANELRGFYERIAKRDETLRRDDNFKRVLIQAANEPEMQAAQNEVASINYWDKVMDGYILPRELKLPLSYGLLFDMGVNFGTGHKLVRLAEEQLGVPVRSKPGQNGITEEQLIGKTAELRKISHDRQAARDNLPGLRVRGDVWVNLIQKGDWHLQGDEAGVVNINGRKVQVRKP